MYDFNYTGRQTIQRNHVGIQTRKEKEVIVFDLRFLDLDHYELPDEAEVYLEAQRKAKFMRFSLGTVGNMNLSPDDNRLSKFEDPDEPLFRIKVVDHDKSALLLARVDGIVPRNIDLTEEGEGESMLPVISRNTGEEIWKIEIDDRPLLILSNRYRKEELSSDRLFRAVVMPQAFRQILTNAFLIDYDGYDPDISDETWQYQWISMAVNLSDSTPPNPEEDGDTAVLEWIDSAVSCFAEDNAFNTIFDNHWEGSTS